jgi:tetratricopeptide (TPR) repeat protein
LRFNLAKALAAKGEIEPARLQLEEAIKLRTDFVAARELLTRIYLAKQDPSNAVASADELLKLDPNNLAGHLSRSTALLMIGDKDKSHRELDYLTANFPKNPEVQYRVGFQAWQEGDYARASNVFGQLHNNDPTDIRGLVGVVETLASQKRLNEAIEQMQSAVKTEPNRRDFNLALASLYVRAERYDDAVRIFSALAAKEPKASDILFRLGETYRLKGDINLAIDTFRKAAQANPNDSVSLMQLALVLEGSGRGEEAKPAYEQILRIDPGHSMALNNLAFAKAEEGVDLDEALRLAQKARQARPDSPDIADTLGWVYIKKQMTQEAIRVFADIVKRQPENPVYRYHYGMALSQRGDKAAAKREFESALLNNPSKDDASKIRDLLKQL